jgi:HPt (histidine-containing phosphotransfer) domain-containing protein
MVLSSNRTLLRVLVADDDLLPLACANKTLAWQPGGRRVSSEASILGNSRKDIPALAIFRIAIVSDQIDAVGPLTNPSSVGQLLPASNSPFSFEEALARAEGDKEFLAEVINLFRTDATGRLREIRAAASLGDARRLQRAAHSLKGAVGYLCAGPTSAAAQDLEQIGESGDLSGAPAAVDHLAKELERLSAALVRLGPSGASSAS